MSNRPFINDYVFDLYGSTVKCWQISQHKNRLPKNRAAHGTVASTVSQLQFMYGHEKHKFYSSQEA